MKQTEDRAHRALEDPSISEHAAACLRYNLACIYHFPEDDIINFLVWEAFEREISMIERGEYDTYLQSPGAKKLYYFTHIDDQCMRYCICLPKGFDPEQRYALLIINTITSADGSMYSYYFERTDAFPDLIPAKRSGLFSASVHVAYPPFDCPMAYILSSSIRYRFSMSARISLNERSPT